MAKTKVQKEKRAAVGGISFFFSYFVLILLSFSNIYVLGLVLSEALFFNVVILLCGAIVGLWAAYTFFSGQISVLIHEYKHAILATLVGNKWKRLKLEGMGGSFQYSYTKDTAQYNAFIGLAPYFLPVLTFFGCIFFIILMNKSIETALLVLGILHGAELYFNWKDASPIQTDLTDIRGGFLVGLGYVTFANIVITSLVMIAALGGTSGLSKLGEALWVLGTLMVAAVRSIIIPAE